MDSNNKSNLQQKPHSQINLTTSQLSSLPLNPTIKNVNQQSSPVRNQSNQNIHDSPGLSRQSSAFRPIYSDGAIELTSGMKVVNIIDLQNQANQQPRPPIITQNIFTHEIDYHIESPQFSPRSIPPHIKQAFFQSNMFNQELRFINLQQIQINKYSIGQQITPQQQKSRQIQKAEINSPSRKYDNHQIDINRNQPIIQANQNQTPIFQHQQQSQSIPIHHTQFDPHHIQSRKNSMIDIEQGQLSFSHTLITNNKPNKILKESNQDNVNQQKQCQMIAQQQQPKQYNIQINIQIQSPPKINTEQMCDVVINQQQSIQIMPEDNMNHQQLPNHSLDQQMIQNDMREEGQIQNAIDVNPNPNENLNGVRIQVPNIQVIAIQVDDDQVMNELNENIYQSFARPQIEEMMRLQESNQMENELQIVQQQNHNVSVNENNQNNNLHQLQPQPTIQEQQAQIQQSHVQMRNQQPQVQSQVPQVQIQVHQQDPDQVQDQVQFQDQVPVQVQFQDQVPVQVQVQVNFQIPEQQKQQQPPIQPQQNYIQIISQQNMINNNINTQILVQQSEQLKQIQQNQPLQQVQHTQNIAQIPQVRVQQENQNNQQQNNQPIIQNTQQKQKDAERQKQIENINQAQKQVEKQKQKQNIIQEQLPQQIIDQQNQMFIFNAQSPQLTDILEIRKLLLKYLPSHLKQLTQTLADQQLRQMYLQIRAEQLRTAAIQNGTHNQQRKQPTSPIKNTQQINNKKKQISKSPRTSDHHKKSQPQHTQPNIQVQQRKQRNQQIIPTAQIATQTIKPVKRTRKQRKRVVTTVVQQIEYFEDESEQDNPSKYKVLQNGELHRKRPTNKTQMKSILTQLCNLVRTLDLSALQSNNN